MPSNSDARLGSMVCRRRSSSASSPVAVWPSCNSVERRPVVLRAIPVHDADLGVRGEPVRAIRVVGPGPVGTVPGREFLARPTELVFPPSSRPPCRPQAARAGGVPRSAPRSGPARRTPACGSSGGLPGALACAGCRRSQATENSRPPSAPSGSGGRRACPSGVDPHHGTPPDTGAWPSGGAGRSSRALPGSCRETPPRGSGRRQDRGLVGRHRLRLGFRLGFRLALQLGRTQSDRRSRHPRG